MRWPPLLALLALLALTTTTQAATTRSCPYRAPGEAFPAISHLKAKNTKCVRAREVAAAIQYQWKRGNDYARHITTYPTSHSQWKWTCTYKPPPPEGYGHATCTHSTKRVTANLAT